MSGRKTIPLFDLLSRSDPATSGLPRVGADRNGPRTPASAGSGTSKVPVPPRGTVPQRDGKPVVRVELKPQATAPVHADGDMGSSPTASQLQSAPVLQPVQSQQAARAGLLTAASAGRTITLPALVPVIIIVAALAAIISTWIFAYHRGANDKSAELTAQLPQSSRPTIIEPGAQLQPNLVAQGGTAQGEPQTSGKTGGSTKNSGNSQTGPQSTKPVANPTGTNASVNFAATLITLQTAPPAAAAIMTSAGWKTAEIRQVGVNYLNIATLKQTDAASAIVFLAQSGVEAFGVPLAPNNNSGLASGRGRANTSSPVTYRIFVLPGITSEQYRARQSVMTNLEASVARLGRQWSRDQKGASDFRSPQWTKFDDK